MTSVDRPTAPEETRPGLKISTRPRGRAQPVNGVSLPLFADTLARILPHRGTAALVDRVDAIDPGRSAQGVKLVGRTDPIVAGHFPDRPVVPGVLLVEMLTQLSGVVLWSMPAAADGNGVGTARGLMVLAGVKRFRFRRLVVPGEVITLNSTVTAQAGSLVEFKVHASVERERVADGSVQIGVHAAESAAMPGGPQW